MIMNRRILSLLCLLCGLAATAQTYPAGVGINTKNPNGVLHIDGTANNLPTGAVSPAQAADDVVIDAEGRTGIGTLPSADVKVNISAATPGGAIRIQDTTEGDGKVLMSDADGIGSWASIATGSWFAALYDGPELGYTSATGNRPFTNYADSVISSENPGSLNKAAGTITLPQTGKYRVTLSIYWIGDNTNSRPQPYQTKAILRANGSDDRQTYNFWSGKHGYGVMPTFINILEFQAGDVLTLVTDETQAAYANNARAVLFMVELLL
jgi:hypothetical protein